MPLAVEVDRWQAQSPGLVDLFVVPVHLIFLVDQAAVCLGQVPLKFSRTNNVN